MKDRWTGYAIVLADGSHVTVIAEAKGYLMVRRPYCVPFVMSVKDAKRLIDPEEFCQHDVEVAS